MHNKRNGPQETETGKWAAAETEWRGNYSERLSEFNRLEHKIKSSTIESKVWQPFIATMQISYQTHTYIVTKFWPGG